MDADDLREEVREWVEAGIISPDQGEEILARYEEDDGGRSRLVLAISLMGAVLVGAGVLWFLVGNWDALPRGVRTVILAATPAGFAAVGHALSRGQTPRVGHALWVLAAAFVGPALFLLADLWSLEVDTAWLFLAWAALAGPAGHLRASRPTTVVGLLAATGTVAALESGADLPAALGLFGVVVFALGTRLRCRLEDAYRLVGVGLVAVTLLLTAIEQRAYDRVALEGSAVVLAVTLGAVAAVAGTWWLEREGDAAGADVGWTAVGTVAVLLGAAAVTAVPSIPAGLALGVVHVGLLGVLVSTVLVAVEVDSSALVNLAAVAFLVQVLVVLATTIVDATSGAAALVLGGVVLLFVGFGLERGRRRVLGRIGGPKDG